MAPSARDDATWTAFQEHMNISALVWDFTDRSRTFNFLDLAYRSPIHSGAIHTTLYEEPLNLHAFGIHSTRLSQMALFQRIFVAGWRAKLFPKRFQTVSAMRYPTHVSVNYFKQERVWIFLHHTTALLFNSCCVVLCCVEL